MEEKLVYNVQVDGAESIPDLENSVEGLGKQSNKTQKEIDKLTKQIADAKGVMKVAEEGSAEYDKALGTLTSSSSKLSDLNGKLSTTSAGVGTALTSVIPATSGVVGGIRGMIVASKAFMATGLGAVIGVIAIALVAIIAVFKKTMDAIKGNEEQSNRLAKAMASLKPITDMITRVFEKLGGVLLTVAEGYGKVVGWFADFIGAGDEVNATTQTYIDLEEEKQKLIVDSRRLQEEGSLAELEATKLREKSFEKDKYSAEERKKFAQQAIDILEEDGEKRLALSKRKLAALEQEGEFTKNNAEFEQRLSDARSEVNKVTKETIESTSRLNKQRIAANNEINKEGAAKARTAQQAKDTQEKIATAQKVAQAELALLSLTREVELNNLTDIASNIKLSNEERINALYKLENEKKYLIEETAKYELKNAELTKEEILVIETKKQNDIIALQVDTNKKTKALNEEAMKKVDLEKAEDLAKEEDRLIANAEARITIASGNIDAEYKLQVEQLDAKKELEIAMAEETGADVTLIEAKYNKLQADASDELMRRKVSNIAELANASADLLSNLSDFTNNLGDAELERWRVQNEGKEGFEEEYARKKEELDRKQAIRGKAIAMMDAIINTAVGVTKASPNIPLMAIVGAAGAAQVAAIAAQPIPMGGGGGSVSSSPKGITQVPLTPNKTALTSRDENLNMMSKSSDTVYESVVKVSEINKVQNKVDVRERNSSY